MPRPLFTPRKDPVPIVQEAGWDPGPVWSGAENLAPTRIRSPDRPASSQSLIGLNYTAHAVTYNYMLLTSARPVHLPLYFGFRGDLPLQRGCSPFVVKNVGV